MSKLAKIVVVLIFAGIFFTAYSYWKSSYTSNLVNTHIYQADMSRYVHRGVLDFDTEGKEISFNDRIASVDNRFFNGEKKEALALYILLLKEDPGNMSILLRLGIIYLQEEDYTLAQDNLNTVYGYKESVYALDAAWFLALMNYQNNNIPTVKTLLTEIIKGRGNYFMEAEELLEILT
ncbi:MAG: hypothetical protein MK207_15085 [Saprospiraceae bacterium]|nr:hypothetical protein [Saprospiraceae bacterium]